MTDILNAIANIIDNPIPDILNHYQKVSNNRINAIGDALEEFIKDAFANTISETDLAVKVQKYSETFSSASFQLIAIIPENKYLSFSNQSQDLIASLSNCNLNISKDKIKSPNNTAKMIDVSLRVRSPALCAVARVSG